MKKLLAIIISVMMITTMVPTMAFAAASGEVAPGGAGQPPTESQGTGTPAPETQENTKPDQGSTEQGVKPDAAEAKIVKNSETTYYETLENAVSAAASGDTITLLKEVTIESPITIDNSKELTFAAAEGSKATINSAGSFFTLTSGKLNLSNLVLNYSGTGGYLINHSGSVLNVKNCDFKGASADNYATRVISINNDTVVNFEGSTIDINARAAFVGVGNGSNIIKNIIDLKGEKYKGTEGDRTGVFSIVAKPNAGAITIKDNEIKNANRAVGIDHSTIAAGDLIYKNNKLIDVRFGFELSGTNNGTGYDLNNNYYSFKELNNGAPQAMKVQDADASGNKFAFGEGSVEYAPAKGESKVKNDVYFIRESMSDPYDLNNYVASSGPAPEQKPEVAPPTVGNTGNIETTVKPDASGKVETTVPSETITESLDKVTQTPSATAKPEVEIVVKEEAGATAPAKTVDVKVPAEAVEKIAKTEDATLKVTTSVGTVKLDNKALNKVATEAKGEAVTITVEKQDVKEIVNPAQKETIETLGKDDHVFELTVKVGERVIHQLGGEATFEIHYVLKKGELPENLKVFYIDNEGKKHSVESKYNEKTQKIVMTTDHFSIFAVSYVDAPSKVKVLKAKSEKGKAALRWSRATNGAEGYRVYRAKAKDGKYTPIAWVKDGKAKTFKEKSKKTNKTYYYKVRAYKTVDGKKVWGEFSPVKKVKF